MEGLTVPIRHQDPRLGPLAVVLFTVLSVACSEGGGVAPGGDSSAAESDISPTAPFEDIAAEVGLDFVHFNGMSGRHYLPEVFGSGAALFDFDGDGDLDLYLVQGEVLGEPEPDDLVYPAPQTGGDRLYRNLLVESGELRFADATAGSGIGGGYGMGVAVGDYDRDGDLDLYVTELGPNRLLRNLGDGRFEEVADEAGVVDRRWSVPALFFDFDGDGFDDLFVGNYVDFNLGSHVVCSSEGGAEDWCSPRSFRPEPDRLWRNRGDGTFEDVSARSGIGSLEGTALGALAADLDADGRLDLYVANDWMANRQWMNLGAGRFEDRALLAATAVNGEGVAEASMGVDAADYDDDGDLDLFLTHLTGETNTLYRNDGGGRFSDVSILSGLGAPSLPATGFGTAWLDYDLDGLLDLLVVDGAIRLQEEAGRADGSYPLAQPDQLYRGLGDGRFELAGVPAAGVPRVGRGAAFGDVDNDGDTDAVVVNNSGPVALYSNRTDPGAWIGLVLETADGRSATGAELAVEIAGRRRSRSIVAGGSYASTVDRRWSVALPAGVDRVTVEVRWQGGVEESFEVSGSGRYHVLREGAGR